MSFDAPDPRRFPGLQLAWEVLDGPVGSTAVLNAANEVAVAAFLDGQIRFDQIHSVNREALDSVQVTAVSGIEDLLAIDGQTRAAAQTVVKRLEV
jgi:1-deoxy-D-xylulose-5-phosphate reductoisomerase